MTPVLRWAPSGSTADASGPDGASDLRISVVVCAYTEDRWDDIVHCVDALRRQLRPAEEIILVVDHNPSLLDRCRAAFREIDVVANEHDRGLSGARNTGVQRASGTVVAFVDEDAAPTPEWLATMAAAYHRPSVVAVGGSITPRWMSARPVWFPDEFLWVVGCTYAGMPDHGAAVRNLIGCNMSVRRELVMAVGGFRTGRVGTLSIGRENDETELFLRIHDRWPDAVVWYDPAVRVIDHRVPPGRASLGYFLRRCLSEGISKARLAAETGRAAVSTERHYVTSALPRGIVDSVRAGAHRPAELSRAAAIVAGLAVTSFGYALGNVQRGVSALHVRGRALTA